jgi:alpha-glucosidase
VPADAQLHLHDRSWPGNLDFVRRLQQRVAARPDGHTLAELTIETPRDRNYAYLAPGALDTAYYVLSPSEGPLSAEEIRGLVEEVLGAGVWPTWAFSNHDIMRGPTRCGGVGTDPRLAELLVALLATLRGNLLIYQGDELGLPHARVPRDRLRDREGIRFHPHGLKRDGARTPMPWSATPGFGGQPWLPYDERHLALAVEAQRGRADSTLAATTGWLAQRRRRSALRHGDLRMLALPAPLLGWTRTLVDETLLCVFNLGADVQVAVLPAGDAVGVLHASAGVALEGQALTLPPFGAALLRS